MKHVVERDMNSCADIIARAGDFKMYANKKSIKIIRQKGNEVRIVNVDATIK
ncbi:MAG: hypothetical protein IPP79_01245 [Chitinophagaceae bacterium]|nr:hypothetical protein [Chitinophagaceae bacterium]